MWLLLAFIAVPLIEIALFIQVGGIIGLWPTLLIVLLTAFIGTTLLRNQGAMAMANLRSSFGELRDPTEPLAHGAMILFSGALLLTPGFFTDAVGFLLLVPAVRSAVFNHLRTKVKVHGFAAHQEQRQGYDSASDVIDGEYQEVDPPKQPTHNTPTGPSGWTKH